MNLKLVRQNSPIIEIYVRFFHMDHRPLLPSYDGSTLDSKQTRIPQVLNERHLKCPSTLVRIVFAKADLTEERMNSSEGQQQLIEVGQKCPLHEEIRMFGKTKLTLQIFLIPLTTSYTNKLQSAPQPASCLSFSPSEAYLHQNTRGLLPQECSDFSRHKKIPFSPQARS